MEVGRSLFGIGPQAGSRRAATVAVATAVAAIARLDALVDGHALYLAWARVERQVAGVAAALGQGFDADLEHVFRARLGATLLPPGHVQLGDLDERERDWTAIARREGRAALRGIVRRLVPTGGGHDLIGLADAVAAQLDQTTAPSWALEADPHSGMPSLMAHARGVEASGAHASLVHVSDLADLTLALPFALRRARLSRALLPAVTGRPRLLGLTETGPLERLERWALTLADQAGQGATRLRTLERYAKHVEATLAKVSRPAALRCLVDIALGSWTVWAAQLARLTGVHVSTAVRTLEQAAALGLVAVVSRASRSRGDGTSYAVPPWLGHAGLISVRRDPPAGFGSQRLQLAPGQGAVGEFEAAMAALDALQGRG